MNNIYYEILQPAFDSQPVIRAICYIVQMATPGFKNLNKYLDPRSMINDFENVFILGQWPD